MTPYRAGVRAFHAGLPRDACPFEDRPTRTRLWKDGWDAAKGQAAQMEPESLDAGQTTERLDGRHLDGGL